MKISLNFQKESTFFSPIFPPFFFSESSSSSFLPVSGRSIFAVVTFGRKFTFFEKRSIFRFQRLITSSTRSRASSINLVKEDPKMGNAVFTFGPHRVSFPYSAMQRKTSKDGRKEGKKFENRFHSRFPISNCLPVPPISNLPFVLILFPRLERKKEKKYTWFSIRKNLRRFIFDPNSNSRPRIIFQFGRATFFPMENVGGHYYNADQPQIFPLILRRILGLMRHLPIMHGR